LHPCMRVEECSYLIALLIVCFHPVATFLELNLIDSFKSNAKNISLCTFSILQKLLLDSSHALCLFMERLMSLLFQYHTKKASVTTITLNSYQ